MTSTRLPVPESARDAITHFCALKRYERDTLYGARAHDSGRFFLHASRIRFTQPTTGQPVALEAELKDWLRTLSSAVDAT